MAADGLTPETPLTPDAPPGTGGGRDEHAARSGTVLRRALFVWGLGHLALGDRRGWVLLALQIVLVGGFIALAGALIHGSRWILLLPLLLLLIAAWIAQAVHAHQAATRLGSAPGGELHVFWLLPAVVAAVTLFWLVGGPHSSPEAALREYVESWRWSRPGAAAVLFREPLGTDTLVGAWAEYDRHLGQRVSEAAATFGPSSGLDPERPFNALQFVEVQDQRTADSAVFAIQITRRQRIETTLFGLLPTATQQTVVVETVGHVEVQAHAAADPSWLPAGPLESRVWLIESVEMPSGRRLGG